MSPMSQEKQQFYRHLQRAGLKRTTQRDLIVDIFLDTEDHLSSEDLYRVVKEHDAVSYTHLTLPTTPYV